MAESFAESFAVGDLVKITGYHPDSLFKGMPCDHIGKQARVKSVNKAAIAGSGSRVIVDSDDGIKQGLGAYWGIFMLEKVTQNLSVGDTVEPEDGYLRGNVGVITALDPGAKYAARRVTVRRTAGWLGSEGLGSYWGHFTLRVIKPAVPSARPDLCRRDLNPGDLFYHTEANSRSKVPLTQLRYVPGGTQHEPDKQLGAVRSPQKAEFWLGEKGLNRKVRRVEGQELAKLLEDAKRQAVTKDQVKTAAAAASIMSIYGRLDTDFKVACDIMGEDLKGTVAELARAAFQSVGLTDFAWQRWAKAATKLFDAIHDPKELPHGYRLDVPAVPTTKVGLAAVNLATLTKAKPLARPWAYDADW